MEPDRKRAKLEADDKEVEACFANDAVELRWLELDSGTTWRDQCPALPPLYSHAFFGEEETIRGYRELRVTLSIDVASFYALLEIEYASKTEDAEDIREQLREKFEYDFMKSWEALSRQAVQFRETFPELEAFGQELLRRKEHMEGDLVVTCCPLADAEEKIKELHYRLEPFVMFFIDGAQCVDTSDPDWMLFCAVHVRGESRRLVGYTTVYRCYAYPDRHRDRIGQIFVLPGHQGKGVGTAMLEAVQLNAERTDAVDVTIEDPTDAVTKIKHTNDMKRMLQSSWICELLLQKQVLRACLSAIPIWASAQGSKDGNAVFILTREERIKIQRTFRIHYRDIELLWNAVLLVGCLQEPEKTAHILECLKSNWSVALKNDVDGKVIFQELSDSGEITESFVMTRCRHSGICKVIDGVMVIPPTSCPEHKQQHESLVTQKLTTTLELATYYSQRCVRS